MKSHAYESKLQQLETEHATEGQLLDIQRSNALATEENELERGYFYSFKVIGSVASISLSTTASYWAFSPAAAVLTVINEDIGWSNIPNHLQISYKRIPGPADNPSLFTIVWSTCVAITVLLFGRISDKFGRRWFVIGASCMALLGGTIHLT
jgi:MFS family permease